MKSQNRLDYQTFVDRHAALQIYIEKVKKLLNILEIESDIQYCESLYFSDFEFTKIEQIYSMPKNMLIYLAYSRFGVRGFDVFCKNMTETEHMNYLIKILKKGHCHYCHLVSHETNKCPEVKKKYCINCCKFGHSINSIHCNYCLKFGHNIGVCRYLKRDYAKLNYT